MHGRHYAGETARRLIKHATLSRPHASRALKRAALRNASGRGSACVLGFLAFATVTCRCRRLRVRLNLTNVDFTHAQSGLCEVARKQGGRRQRRLLMLAQRYIHDHPGAFIAR